MTIYVLAGDIGGTKTNLALYAVEESNQIALVREASFSSADYDGLEGVIRDFRQAGQEPIAAGAFGIAGPVLEDKVVATNLPKAPAAVSHCYGAAVCVRCTIDPG